MAQQYNLAEFIERRLEDAGIPIELRDGSTVVMPPPELWPDEVAQLMADDDFAAAARLILGTDEYDRFVASGGTWKLLNAILIDSKGATAGESSASSES